MDVRGHGESAKPHYPEAYGTVPMTEDVIALMDRLSIRRAGLVGYSLGSRLCALLLLRHPDRFSAAVLGGIGWDPGDRGIANELFARALEGSDQRLASDPRVRQLRASYERRGSDFACARGLHARLPTPAVRQPVGQTSSACTRQGAPPLEIPVYGLAG
jgi:pimeloyl-ACP methyl ester carboxylesterase